MKTSILAVCLAILSCVPASAGDCLGVSIVQNGQVVAQLVTPQSSATQVSQFALFNQRGGVRHQSAVHAPSVVQAFAVPVIAHQAFVVRQQHCAQLQQRFVVERRVRRERRGLARVLFGR